MDYQAIFKDKRILLAEDEPSNQELMKDIFEDFECVLDIAQNGNEVLKKLEQNHYDLILMDMQMPEKDGYQTTREIRSTEHPAKRVPIIALTANALSGDREKCLAYGMDDYISKPIDLHEIRTKVGRILQKKGG